MVTKIMALESMVTKIIALESIPIQGVIPGGLGGGAVAPPTFGQQHFFSGFSHTTDRKVPSEVVLMGSFMSVLYGNVR